MGFCIWNPHTPGEDLQKTLETTSKPNRWLTVGSVLFHLVAIVLNNENHLELDGTAGQLAVGFWSHPLPSGVSM